MIRRASAATFAAIIFVSAAHAATDSASSAAAIESGAYRKAFGSLRSAMAQAEGSDWTYSSIEDPMTHKNIWTAAAQSIEKFDLGFPYQGPQNATLSIRRHPRFGANVMLAIERGQIVCSQISGCTVEVRFDAGPVETYAAESSADGSSDVIFIKNYTRFVGKASRSKRVAIAVIFFQNGNQSLEFKIAGLKAR